MNIRNLVTIVITLTISLIAFQAFSVYTSSNKLDKRHTNDRAENLSRKSIHIDRDQVYFEQNVGQVADDISYTSSTPGYKLSLKQEGATLQIVPQSATDENPTEYWQLNIRPHNAAKNTKIVAESQLNSTSSYFYSQDKSTWFQGVPHYKSVSYKEIYPGIDLKYYGTKQNIEYDFIVKAGKNTDPIEMTFDGIENITLDSHGNAILNFNNHQLVHRKPIAYQLINGRRIVVPARYELRSHDGISSTVNLGFKIDSWDKKHDLIIDPVIAYSTQMGGDLFDAGGDVTVDQFGNAYTVSHTFSSNELQSQAGLYSCENACKSDVVVSKFGTDGEQVLWTVLLSGSGDEDGLGIEVDSLGNTFVAGWTDSLDFPTLNAVDDSLNGLSDGFLTKISATGTELLFSTYFGSGRSEVITDIAKSNNGNIYVSGRTSSPNELSNSHSHVIETNGFISQFSDDGSVLHFTKYIGGSRYDSIDAIAVDRNNNIFFTGTTNSEDFPVVTALYPELQGVSDAFVGKMDASGTLIFNSYLGGGLAESAKDIALDKSGNPVVTGVTTSSDFPLNNPLFAEAAGTINDWDTFISRLNKDGTQLLSSTYIGGNQGDYVSSLTLDNNNNIYISGYTLSNNFPTQNALNSTLNGRSDLFISKLSPTADELLYSTYFGGSGDESQSNIAVDSAGSLYMTGLTYSTDFLNTNSANFMKNSTGGNGDAFISKITDLIKLNLEAKKWYIVALPYVPSSGSTVAEIFGDDIVPTYGSDWYMYSYSSAKGKYLKLSLTDIIDHGIAYWIRQLGETDVLVDVPNNSAGALLTTGLPCPIGQQCFIQPITKSGAVNQYHFIGNPFSSPVPWDNIRLITDTGSCSVDTGCTLTEAASENLIESYARSYFQGSSVFLSAGSIIKSWQGFYIRSFADAFGKNPRLVFAY